MSVPSPYAFILACLMSYGLGGIPFGLILVKLAGKGDVRDSGSGNIGATNVLRVGGKWLGVLTLLLDILKGFLPVFFVMRIGLAPEITSMVALAAVIGHIYTPWLKFEGGKGVATALGAVLGYHPAMALPSLCCFIVTLVIFRYVSLASIFAALVLIPSATGLLGSKVCIEFANPNLARYGILAWIILPTLVIRRHASNIVRLLKGTENKLWNKSKQGKPDV